MARSTRDRPRRGADRGIGLFVRLNRAAEDVEPEAMQQAKDEDRKLD